MSVAKFLLKTSDKMDPSKARELFETGGILLVLDAPSEMRFGIDLFSWDIGQSFLGIKMIPPGVHICFYEERDKTTKDLSSRQSFLINVESPKSLLTVVRWSPSESRFERETLTDEQYEARRNQRYELDRQLGQYPLEIYRQWLSLSNHFDWKSVETFLPVNGQICSTSVYLPNEEKSFSNDLNEPKNLHEAESRMPKLRPDELYSFRWTKIDENLSSSLRGSRLTESKLDPTEVFETILENQRVADGRIFLCELQLSFLLFFLGQVYEAFEHWKKLFHFIGSCRKNLQIRPKFYIDFLQIVYFQLKIFAAPENSSFFSAEHFFVEIDQRENFLHKSLENFFANLSALNDEHQMKNDQIEKLVERSEKLKIFLFETFRWSFDDEPEDEKPIVVEL